MLFDIIEAVLVVVVLLLGVVAYDLACCARDMFRKEK